MKNKLFLHLFHSLIFMLIALPCTAIPNTIENVKTHLTPPLVPPSITLNVGMEINGLEQAVDKAASGMQLMGQSLRELANHPDLTEEQKNHIQQVLTRIDTLNRNLNTTVSNLPDTIKNGISPIVQAGEEIMGQIKWIAILSALLIILIIIAALAGTYYFVLAPGSKTLISTATQLSELSNSLNTAAEIVEKTAIQNAQTIKEIKKLQQIPASLTQEQG
jgi:predicted PurR-regulated permease PerM